MSVTNDAYYYYSASAGGLGCAAFYLVLTIRVTFTQRIKHLIVSFAVGVIAFAVSSSYYPSKDEIINYAVIPFASGFLAPLLTGIATIVYQFSQNPYIVLEKLATVYAKIITAIRGGKN